MRGGLKLVTEQFYVFSIRSRDNFPRLFSVVMAVAEPLGLVQVVHIRADITQLLPHLRVIDGPIFMVAHEIDRQRARLIA